MTMIEALKALGKLNERANYKAPEQLAHELMELASEFAAISGVPLPEDPEDTPTPQVWPKQCPCCKRVHSEAGWNGLTLVGFCGAFKSHGVRYACELRNCVCASTIGVEVQLPMATATKLPTFLEQRAAQVAGIAPTKPVSDSCCCLPFGHAGNCEPF